MNGGESEELPQCVRDLAGKEIVFHIRVTPFNFTPSHHTFTVSSILDSIPSEVLHIILFGLPSELNNFLITEFKLSCRRLRPLKMNMFRLKVVKRRHLPARMSKVKLMNQVHLLMEAQKGPVNASVSEVKKQDHRQPTYVVVSSMHFLILNFPFPFCFKVFFSRHQCFLMFKYKGLTEYLASLISNFAKKHLVTYYALKLPTFSYNKNTKMQTSVVTYVWLIHLTFCYTKSVSTEPNLSERKYKILI